MIHTTILLYHNKLAWIINCIVLAFLLTIYIVQINALTAAAYAISDQEDAIRNLKNEVKTLEIQYVDNSTFWSLKELALQHNFEKITNVIYIKSTEGIIAKSGITQ